MLCFIGLCVFRDLYINTFNKFECTKKLEIYMYAKSYAPFFQQEASGQGIGDISVKDL